MSQLVTALRRGRTALLAACIAALIAGFPTESFAATASWSVVPSPSPSSDATLSDVTCVSASDCWAVGFDVINSQTLIEHTSGSGWVIVTSPNPAASRSSDLTGVTCLTSTECWAVGSYIPGSGGLSEATLVEHYNGTGWAIVSSPNPGTTQNRLANVKCIDASNCWAVGTFWGPGVAQTLFEHYTGGNWVVGASGFSSALLQDVACASLQNDCWAVGWRFDSTCTNPNHQCTLFEHNAGSGWAVVPSPDVPTANGDSLISVTCMSATNCWAVGAYRNATKARTLTEHYDGSAWSIVPSPNTGSNSDNLLTDVSCGSSGDCWAVGVHNCCNNRTLIEHSTGSGWVIVKSPNPSPLGNTLSAIKCVTTRNCWAVGTSAGKTLIERYK